MIRRIQAAPEFGTTLPEPRRTVNRRPRIGACFFPGLAARVGDDVWCVPAGVVCLAGGARGGAAGDGVGCELPRVVPVQGLAAGRRRDGGGVSCLVVAVAGGGGGGSGDGLLAGDLIVPLPSSAAAEAVALLLPEDRPGPGHPVPDPIPPIQLAVIVAVNVQSEEYTSSALNDASIRTACEANGPDGIPTRYRA